MGHLLSTLDKAVNMKMRLTTKNSAISILLHNAVGIFVSTSLLFAPLASAGTLSFSTSSYSISENASNLSITVNRTGDASAAAAVTVVSENGSAAAGSDFTAVSQNLSWGTTDSDAKTFTVSITDDAIFEGGENFTLKFTSATGDSTGAAVTVTITDYEEGKLQFSSSTFSGQEDSLQVTATISRLSGTNGPATVKLKSSETTDSVASIESDYAALDTTVSFADGEATKNVNVILKNDNIAELSKFFKLTLSDPTSATLGTVVSATVEIKDTDSDFTSSLKLLAKTDANIIQSQLVDLTQNSIVDSKKKILDLVNAIPILKLTELEAKQTDGLMTIDVETDRVYLRPTAIKRSAVGATPNINVRDDINSTFSTSEGWYLEATPALANKGLNVLQQKLAEIFLPDLVIEDNGNITIQVDQGAPPFERDASNNVVVNYKFYDRWNLRPSMISTVSTAATEGYSLIRHPNDADEVVMAVTYADAASKRQQILSPAPVNGPELIQELTTNGINRCLFNPGAGCQVTVVNPKQMDYGIVAFDVESTNADGAKQTIQFKLFSDYKIRKTPNFVPSMVGFTEINDINRDSFADYKMVYANGEEQYFFLVNSIVK